MRKLLALSMLAGCIFSSPPETKYYTLRGDAASASPAPKGAPAVLLDRFTIDDAYADDRIAYRQGSHELGFDPYARWAGPPASQVEDAVRDLLKASGLFSAVRQLQPLGEGRSGYDYVITARIGRLEEIDASSDEWQGGLDIELYLLDGKSRAVLFSLPYTAARRAEKRNPREVAAALAALLADAVSRFADGVRPIVARSRENQ